MVFVGTCLSETTDIPKEDIMRLYLNTKEVPKVIEVLENSPERNTPEIANVIERMKKCERLQKQHKTRLMRAER